MKLITKIQQLFFIGLLIAMAGTFLYAQQNTLSTTTLSSAMTNSQTFVQLASTTNVVGQSFSGAGSFFYVDRELMQAIAVTPIGTTGTQNLVTVSRGVSGTPATAHLSGVLVLIGPGNAFSNAGVRTGVGFPSGTCTVAANEWYPVVAPLSGEWFTCSATGAWGYAGPSGLSFSAPPSITKISATYTALWWDNIIEATANSFTLTLPTASQYPGKVYFLTNAGSGTMTVTTATGCASIAAAAAGCRVVSDGTAWRTF